MSTIESTVTIVVTIDEVDAHTGPLFAGELDSGLRLLEAEGTAAELVVDLRNVAFMGSTGIRCLLETDQAAGQQGRRLVLTGVQAVVHRSLEVTGVLDHLQVRARG
jgi:anti-anti-sigma factor